MQKIQNFNDFGNWAHTGYFHFDLLFNRDSETDTKILTANGIDINRKFILFATQHSSFDQMQMMLTGVIKAMQQLEDFQVVVKVHPREDIDPYLSFLEKFDSSRIYVTKDIELNSLLSQCELLITMFSTTALEAMMPKT